ncbi:MAG: DMT family transporter [Negativicutes bacterium]|nr:DMT family transporter [Negativicutes bacterium]
MSLLKSNLILLLAAAIWGFAFVAQRVGMEYIGPYTFNGVRFALGSLSLLPLIIFFSRKPASDANVGRDQSWKSAAMPGFIAGMVLFLGASLQQVGLIYTEAGKAAFITCLYIVIVPLISRFVFKQPLTKMTLSGCLVAAVGLYLLCVKESFTISFGDLLELIGALFWSAHILLIDKFSRKIDVLKLAFLQFATCSLLSLATGLAIESVTLTGLHQAMIPILYGGICSVGVAYTLQIVGQKYAQPSHAAVILSMETVFAAVGGFILLDERLGTAELAGCALMFGGMLLSQLKAGDAVKGAGEQLPVSE